MAFSLDSRYMQAFRSPTSGEIVHVQVKTDLMSMNPIVLWSDILQKFKRAKSIKDGDSTVLFLTERSLEDAIPRRIAYYDRVLDVVEYENRPVRSNSRGEALVGHLLGSRTKTLSSNTLDRVNDDQDGVDKSRLRSHLRAILDGQEFHAQSIEQFMDQHSEELMDTKDRALQEL
ncbi:MAG: hypothetical protein J3Q66DRAFT_386104, partial [Benniella sp.]